MKPAVSSVVILFCLLAAPAIGQQNAVSTVPPSLIMELLSLGGDLETPAKPLYLSPTAIIASPDKKTVYVACQTAKRVLSIDCATQRVVQTILLPNEPTGLAISPDAATLYVTCASERWPSGMVCVVGTAGGTVTGRIPAGHFCRSPVISPDGSKLYVCNWFNNSVSVIDLASQTEAGRCAVTREPYAAALTPDGATLVVTNALPDQKATDTTTIACRVSLIDTKTFSVTASIPLPIGSHSLFGLCISPDGKYAFSTHLIARFTIPALTITAGWVHSNNLAIIDIANKKLFNDAELDYMNRGLANPWGVGCTGDGGLVCVLHAGTGEMSIIDLPQLLAKAGTTPDLSHDFAAILSIKTVVGLQAKGPRSLAIVDNKVYIAGYFSDSLDVVALNPSGAPTLSRVALSTPKPLTRQRQGESNFCDASLCMQKWQSCHSCHPFTRPDALNWILNSEVSAPKNVKSMLYTFQTPPTSWAGKRPAAGGQDGSVRAGIRSELFIDPNEDVAIALDTFLMRLKPVPSPHLVKGRLSESAKRGKLLYTRVGCHYCHPAPLYTNLKSYNVGVTDPFDANTSWDTPTVIESWRTGPYGHLGSFDRLEDIILLRGHSLDASTLSAQEIKELLEYILSL
jgi:YVTN family beta-propeller protein